MSKRILLFLLLFASLLFAFDRTAAYLYLPKEGATRVVIYTTEWCPYCKALRKTLNAYEIPYQDYDTEKSLRGIMGFWALRARGVPVVVIGEEVIYGYDGEKITHALVNAGYTIPARWEPPE